MMTSYAFIMRFNKKRGNIRMDLGVRDRGGDGVVYKKRELRMIEMH